MGQPRVLVAYASRAGGTREIAHVLALRVERAGALVDLEPVERVDDLTVFDAVVIGSAVYFGSWETTALHFIERHLSALRGRPLWLFSSGPLDPGQAQAPIDPPRGIRDIAARLGAREHRTFGGVLTPATTGIVGHFLADSGLSGDYRDMAAIRAWGDAIAAHVVRLSPWKGDVPQRPWSVR